MMGSLLFFILFIPSTFALQLCTDSTAPITLKEPLSFCSYNGSSCCSAANDTAIEKQFKDMNITDSSCASLVQSLLCAKCSPYSADLFTIKPKIRTIPVLCNSSLSASSISAKDSASDFCDQVWDACADVSIHNSPFAPLLDGSAKLTPSKLTDLWQSKSKFCQAFGGSTGEESLCFDGKSVSFNSTQASAAAKGICLERIGNGTYFNMEAHPDGSDRVFLANQAGQIFLAKVPGQGSGGTLELDESNPFIDISDEVLVDSVFGVMGMAFHPNFTHNGRFFVSFNCDKASSPSCSGKCACNSAADCDPSKLGADNGVQPCQYLTVIAEFTANGSSSTPSTDASANPYEVRRIFSMGLPFTGHHGGQILFGPADGYLYLMTGDASNGDPYNFAQNKKSLLGKILRLDVNTIPSQSEINELGLWGNYSIPKDNPFAEDSELEPEIWALGLSNPWRCSFDSERPSYYFCADVGQVTFEEINLISKGGNYGWRIYEGPVVYKPTATPGGNTSANSINAIFPVMGYYHSDLNNSVGSASVIGGYVYRSMTDPCMYGRYFYADLYAGAMWLGTETPENSGNYSSNLTPFSCAKDSPIPCETVQGSAIPSLGYIYSFAEDKNKDVFVLTSKGVYRVVPPSRCGYVCPTERVSDIPNPAPGPSSSMASRLAIAQTKMRLLSLFFLVLTTLSF